MICQNLYLKALSIGSFKGKRGIVSIEKKGNKLVAVKIKNPDAKTCRLFNEAEFLQKLNRHGIGPGFISFDRNELKMEFIGGKRIIDYFHSSGKRSILQLIDNVLEQCFILDMLGIDKEEMTNPYKHIIVRKGKPVMIDFERARYTEKPKNVTQFIQFLTSRNIERILMDKGICIDKKKLFELAKEYKYAIMKK